MTPMLRAGERSKVQSQVSPKVRVRTNGARTQTQAGGSRLSAGNAARIPHGPGTRQIPQ